jgi:hypothetical protein
MSLAFGAGLTWLRFFWLGVPVFFHDSTVAPRMPPTPSTAGTHHRAVPASCT